MPSGRPSWRRSDVGVTTIAGSTAARHLLRSDCRLYRSRSDPCATLCASSWSFCSPRAAARPRRIGRPSRSALSSRSGPAARPTSFRASCSIRCPRNSASRSWSRTGAAPAARIGAAAVAKAEPGRLYAARAPRPRIPSRRSIYASLPYDPAADFAAVDSDRQRRQRADHLAVEGHQDDPGLRRRRQGQAWLVQLRVGRRRLSRASERRATSA